LITVAKYEGHVYIVTLFYYNYNNQMMEILTVGYIYVCRGIIEQAADRKWWVLLRSVRATTQPVAAGSRPRFAL
jgi:hypothetical protein